MFVKIMGSEDCPDADSRKTFSLVSDATLCHFARVDGEAVAYIETESGKQLAESVPGNAYVMNSDGVTVATYGSAKREPLTVTPH